MTDIEPSPELPRATTVLEAAHGPALEFRARDPGSYYVERPRLEVHGRAPPPFSAQVRNRLLGDGSRTLLLTGQTGSGKSAELQRVLGDPAVHTRFERVEVRFREMVSPQHAEIRATLLAVATCVAEHLAEAHPESSPGERFSRVRRWFDGLKEDYEDVGVAPSAITEAGVMLGTPLARLTAKMRDEERLRTRVLQDPRFDVSELLALINALVSALSEVARRPVLIVLDDADKLTEEGPVFDIFIENFGALTRRLEGSKIITFPYWLWFSERFGETVQQADKSLCLDNVKVFSGPGSTDLLPDAEDFFRRLVFARLEPRLIDDDAIRLAARHSAGIPRELLRILRLVAEDAVDYGQQQIDAPLVEATLTQLRRDMSRATQKEATAEALKRIRRERRLREKDDRFLLRSLLVVELPNDNPWYDVHPILQGYVDGLP